MKIFVDCRWFSQPGQGVVTYLAGLHHAIEALPATHPPHEFWYGVEDLSTIDRTLLPPGARVLELGRRGMLWRLLILPFVLRRHGFEVAHFQYICPLLKLGVRYVTTIHDVLFLRYPGFFSLAHRLPRRVLYSFAARRSDLVLTVSERSALDIEELLRPQLPPVVVYNGAGVPAVAAQPPQETRFESLRGTRYLLTVGRVEPRKNYARLADAFAASGLVRQGARLVIVGFCANEFASEVERFRDVPGVLWLERVTDADLAWLYAHTDGFVYPSLCEGFGIPVLEAIQAGVPVALSSTFPLADVVAAVPLVFNPEDTPSITNALQRLWHRDFDSRPCQGVLKKYTWSESARAYNGALARLARVGA